MMLVCLLGESRDKQQFQVNSGSYELPLFKPPVCKLADSEADVSSMSSLAISIILGNH